MASLLSQFERQPQVQRFLMQAVATQRLSQAYLFVGAPGSGRREAAWALAEALLCEGESSTIEGEACGACDACQRVQRHTHPDVHLIEPESSTGYLIAQTRALLEEVALAPIRGQAKVYIIDCAEQLRANTANALLKTLEEPPQGVVFILLASHVEAMLETIVSRCQCVPFRVLDPEHSYAELVHKTGATPEQCRIAYTLTGNVAQAEEYLRSPERQAARQLMLKVLDELLTAPEDALLDYAARLAEAGSETVSSLEAAQKAMREEHSDYLSRGALKQLEDRHKRERSALVRSGIMELIGVARSVLRDALMQIEGVSDSIVNTDASPMLEALCMQVRLQGVLHALDAVAQAEQHMAHNVTPQLALEVMLFDMRKRLRCP
ncbi:DNA polymerase III subunit delta' [Collinsella sp. zg1085]|uniref:DNA polymerase III subunit delta' n=1 Tax=Collinsella sp. zg1085 TaxID=2844380 RepID=UPI001C0E45AA|nr:DNA polymerase III subunit delta' [Collinsella sp. zg1085]QWT17372.1 DNA polymerase III subunit delta' [Collinsella sp. zg1085]